jgi:DNA repair exonuclease SbcCD nuclease subunit
MSCIKFTDDESQDLNLAQDSRIQITKFIHASDIHLGSHQYENTSRSDDYIKTFQEILTLAIENKVDFIILSGDVFTSLEMLPGKLIEIIKMIKRFIKATENKVPIIAIEGNHDIRRFSRGMRFDHRDQSWLKLCADLDLIILLDADFQDPSGEIFKWYDHYCHEGGKLQVNNIVIYGTRYLGEQPISHLSKIRKGIKKEKGKFNILLQHFGVEGQMKNVPGIKLEMLNPLHHRVDYLALGHFHKQFILDDWVFNPGSTEAVCSIDFSFNRGVFLVEITGDKVFSKKIKKIKLKNRSHIWCSLRFRFQFKKKEEFYSYLIKHVKRALRSDGDNDNEERPVLLLKLSGIKPFLNQKINQREIQKILSKHLPITGAKVYLKFNHYRNTIIKYLQ